jgi:hypothetical protein
MHDHHSLTVRGISRHIREGLLNFGVVAASGPEMSEARELAARMIGGTVVSAEALDRVQAHSGCAVFVAHEAGELTGVLAFILLNAAGKAAVLSGAFDGADPDLAHVAAPDEVYCAAYGWGICATNKDTARRLLTGSAETKHLTDHVPCYARPVTEAGERLMRERLGYVDLPECPGMVWLPPVAAVAQAAA